MVTTANDLKLSKPDLIESLLRIDNKEGLIVPFKFNKMQRYFALNKSNRNIILKHRQGGCSSGILGDMYTDCIFIPHTTCAVVSHETRATQRLLDRVQFYYDSMDEPRPPIGAESRSEKTFPDTHSSIYVGTAGSRAFGRGDTIRKALLSELAFYEDAEKILNSVEDSVPITGELTIECTPNGEDNVLYYEWKKAREGKSPFKPFFFPWWWTPEFSIPRDSVYALLEDMGELTYIGDEIELVEKFNLTEDQIRWRRWKIAEKGGLFWQEYPEDEISCFITVGDPVFDADILSKLTLECYDGEAHSGGWTFWVPPQEGMQYVIGADTSAGAPGGSYSAAAVLDSNWNVCATFMARVEPHVFAGILKEMGKWYNKAEIAVERNFTGYAVLGHMQDYGNLYYQRDFLSGKITEKVGWWTDDKTRPYMHTALKDHLAQMGMWSMNLVRQLRGYRYIKFKPTAKSYNDLAIALMIAVAVKKVSGVARGFQGAAKGWSW